MLTKRYFLVDPDEEKCVLYIDANRGWPGNDSASDASTAGQFAWDYKGCLIQLTRLTLDSTKVPDELIIGTPPPPKQWIPGHMCDYYDVAFLKVPDGCTPERPLWITEGVYSALRQGKFLKPVKDPDVR